MKYLRTPDAVKGRLLVLDCLAKMESLIRNLLPHNATETCKLILTASHALLQAKSPFLQTLSMTIMLSGTDHFLLPAPDRTLTKAGMIDPMSILGVWFFAFFLRAEWLILKDEAQAKYNHLDEHTRPGQRCQEQRSVQRDILWLGSLYEVIFKEARHFLCSRFVDAFHFASFALSFILQGRTGTGPEDPTSSLQPSSSPWGSGLESRCSLGVFISWFLKNLTNVEMTVGDGRYSGWGDLSVPYRILPHPAWGFPGGSDGKESACNVGDLGSKPGLGRSPGEENGYPLWYSCLENPMDRGAWQTTVHGVTKSQTRLHDWTHTQSSGWVCSMLGSMPSSQKLYKIEDFWKYFSYRILLPLCKRKNFFSGFCFMHMGIPSFNLL